MLTSTQNIKNQDFLISLRQEKKKGRNKNKKKVEFAGWAGKKELFLSTPPLSHSENNEMKNTVGLPTLSSNEKQGKFLQVYFGGRKTVIADRNIAFISFLTIKDGSWRKVNSH